MNQGSRWKKVEKKFKKGWKKVEKSWQKNENKLKKVDKSCRATELRDRFFLGDKKPELQSFYKISELQKGYKKSQSYKETKTKLQNGDSIHITWHYC